MGLLRKIIALVCVGHAAVLAWMGGAAPLEIKPPLKRPMVVVQTVTFKEEKVREEKVIEAPKMELVAKATPVKKEEPDHFEETALPKKKAKKDPPKKPLPKKPQEKLLKKPPPPKKVEKPAPKPTKKDPSDSLLKKEKEDKRAELLAQAEKSMRALEKKEISKKEEKKNTLGKNSIAIPQKIETLHIDAGGKMLTETEATYRDALATELKRFLRLPEWGEMKVELTLARTGAVEKVAVIDGKSVLNRTYLESTLPTLKFSQFSKNFIGHTQYTFVITLTNQ